jgi:hypothetical protein
LDPCRSLELLERLDPARSEDRRNRRRLRSEHERHRVRVLVGDEPALEQRLDESRRRRATDLPLRPRPSACAQRRPNLGKHVVDLFEREPLPLHRVPG